MERILGVFAKWPQPGRVKTRLAAALGAEGAANLYEAFLRDFLTRIGSFPGRRILAYAPEDARNFFSSLVGDRFELTQQRGGDLGSRMAGFFEDQFTSGTRPVVLVGSDTPDLPTERIELAFAELIQRDVVIGPCEDGGYYLIGMSRFIPEAFADVEWSSGAVFRQTLRSIRSLPVRVAILEPWYDIDRLADLRQLSVRIGLAHQAGRDPQLPHTERVLRSLVTSL